MCFKLIIIVEVVKINYMCHATEQFIIQGYLNDSAF